MLILYESSVGFSLFRVLDEDKLKTSNVDNIFKEFETQSKRSNFIQLHAFQPFKDMDEARHAAKCINDGEKLPKSLTKLIKKNVIKKNLTSDAIGVIEPKIGTLLKNKYAQLNILSDSSILELHRGLRQYFVEWLSEMTSLSDIKCGAMNLGLSHVLSRHKIQFSAEKVDTMIIQAISLLDELDKEINIYAMRCKEWYGWHFPEMNRIINDNIQYCKIIMAVGMRKNLLPSDLSDIIDSDTEVELKNICKISMGSDITESDLKNIKSLAEQVLDLMEYRNELYDYLRKRMMAIAPNLTLMVGELVGARLLSHAGSLVNLAKYPASTVQILGAEKALFRALKTKSDTPKYGLIYHASFVNAATQMNKAKIARTLACKTSLSARVDAFSHSVTEGKESEGIDIATKLWQKMEKRINFVEGHKVQVKSKTLAGSVFKKHSFGDDATGQYEVSDDFKVGGSKKRKEMDNDSNEDEPSKKKRKLQSETEEVSEASEEKKEKKKKSKKDKKKKKKKKKSKDKKGKEEND